MRILAILLILLAFPASAQTRADPEAATGLAPKPLVTGTRHMIVTANPHATAAGRAMLRAGGSAADAAIAALLVLNVVEPQSSGIGGGAFALVHAPDGLTAWDAREKAPHGATPEMFLDGAGAPLPFLAAVASGRSVGVPGLVALMETLHRRHGRIAWGALFAPAILLARSGFPVSPRLAGLLAGQGERMVGSDAARIFMPGGKPLKEGQILRQPRLAVTLEALARRGAAAFYEGAIASEIAAATRRAPLAGTLSPADLAAYRVVARAPVCHPFRAARVCGMGPPSSGATTVGQILMLMDRFDLAGASAEDPRTWHLFAEASRLAYADRARYLADPDVVDVPVRGLLDPSYIDERSRLINPLQASAGPAEAGEPPWREGRLHAPAPPADSPGTTHLSVIDADGLAISLTASIESAFGSGRMAAGFLLNNQLTDFAFLPAAGDGRPIANAVAPGKRPRSSMAPTIVYQGGVPAILTGSPGGSRIPEYVAGSLLALLVFGFDAAAAAALPHVSHRNGDAVSVEPSLPAGVREGLRAMGHAIEAAEMTSGLHIVAIAPGGALSGGADPRREGVAAAD